jgi:hypothetical protein
MNSMMSMKIKLRPGMSMKVPLNKSFVRGMKSMKIKINADDDDDNSFENLNDRTKAIVRKAAMKWKAYKRPHASEFDVSLTVSKNRKPHRKSLLEAMGDRLEVVSKGLGMLPIAAYKPAINYHDMAYEQLHHSGKLQPPVTARRSLKDGLLTWFGRKAEGVADMMELELDSPLLLDDDEFCDFDSDDGVEQRRPHLRRNSSEPRFVNTDGLDTMLTLVEAPVSRKRAKSYPSIHLKH